MAALDEALRCSFTRCKLRFSNFARLAPEEISSFIRIGHRLEFDRETHPRGAANSEGSGVWFRLPVLFFAVLFDSFAIDT